MLNIPALDRVYDLNNRCLVFQAFLQIEGMDTHAFSSFRLAVGIARVAILQFTLAIRFDVNVLRLLNVSN